MSSLTPGELAEIQAKWGNARGCAAPELRQDITKLLGHIDHLESAVKAANQVIDEFVNEHAGDAGDREASDAIQTASDVLDEHAELYERLAPKDVGSPRTQRVRVLVLIAPDGRYNSGGYGGPDGHSSASELDWLWDWDVEPCDVRRHWIEADVPLHAVNAIEGTHAGEVTDE